MNVGPSDQENLQQGIYCDFIISILWWWEVILHCCVSSAVYVSM